MTKSKVFESLKVIAYLIGFPLMSLIMLITFIPMLDAEFMGDFAVIWIVVTLAIWAFVAIIQYIFHVALSKKSGRVKDAANIAVMVIAILSVLVPGAIFGAVQAKNYNAVVAAALKDGVQLDERDSLMGWFKSFTDEKDNAIIDLEKDINEFINAYGLKDYETELFGTAEDNAAGIGYYPGVHDKIKDELKRKKAAYEKLQAEIAKRTAVEEANEAVLKPLREAYEAAKKQSDVDRPVIQKTIDEYYAPLNTIYDSSVTIDSTQLFNKMNFNFENEFDPYLRYNIEQAITKATQILGGTPQAVEDNILADKIKQIGGDVFPKIQAVLTATAAALADEGNTEMVKPVEDAAAEFSVAKNAAVAVIDEIIAALSIDVTAVNAQTILNQATSAKTALDEFINDFETYRTGTENTISSYYDSIGAALREKNAEIKAIDDALATTEKVYTDKIAEQVPSYYPFDGYPTSIRLVESETLYRAEVPNLITKTLYDLGDYSATVVYVLDPKNPVVTIESSTPFKYPTYTTTQVTGSEDFLTNITVDSYVLSGYADAEKKEVKRIPLIDTLLDAFGINYAELTKSITDANQLVTSDIRFVRPDNVDQVVEWLVPMLVEQFLGADASQLLGRDVTFDDINALLEKAFNILYPMGEDGTRQVNQAISNAIDSLLGGSTSGILGFLMPYWDIHNRLTVIDENTETDYFSGLLLTAAWALDTRIGLGDIIYGILPPTIDIVIGQGPIALAQAEYDSGYTEEQLLELQYKLNNYPEIIAFANFWHVCVIFAGIVLLSMILSMYFAKKQKQYALPESVEEEV